MPACDLEVVDSSSVPKLFKERFDSILFSGPREKRDRFADGFFGCVTENACCAGIPTRDDAVE